LFELVEEEQEDSVEVALLSAVSIACH
jgi:hypothetical protein